MKRLASIFCLLPSLAMAEPLRLQGYVEGEYVRVGPTGAGTLARIMVKDGDRVASGAPLFALDDVIERAARDQAKAELERAEAQLADLGKGQRPDELKAINEQKAQAQAALRLSEVTLKRQDVLAKADYASRARLDEARAAVERDRAQVRRLEAEYRTASAGARPDEITAQNALVGHKRLELAKAEKRLADLSPLAPAEALVEKVYYRVGEFVPAGGPVVSLLPPGNVKLVFFLPEPWLGALKVGDAVTYGCDRCPTGEARVSVIATQAEYTPPVIYSVESRDKLVFRVEARGMSGLNPGQPVDVWVKPK